MLIGSIGPPNGVATAATIILILSRHAVATTLDILLLQPENTVLFLLERYYQVNGWWVA